MKDEKNIKYGLFSSIFIAFGPILWLFINVYDKNTVTLFPWDGNLQEDIITMDNVPARDNIYSFCVYIINKTNSNN